MKLRPITVRMKITLWMSGVLFAVLVLFGFGFLSAAQSRVQGAFDQDLFDRARQIAGGVRLGGPPIGRQGRVGQGGPRAPESGPAGGGFRRRGGGQLQGQPPAPPDFFTEGDELANIRRPRWIGRDGRALGGQEGDGAWSQALLESSLSGNRGSETIDVEGRRLRVVSVPVRRGNQVESVVQLARELDDLELLMAEQRSTLLLLIPLALLIAGGGGWLLAGRALRPVKKMALTATEIGGSSLSRRLETEGDDEFSELGGAFNEMLDRLDASFQDREAAYAKLQEAFELQARFSADASHELRTPLARMKIAVSAALSQKTSETDLREALETADQSAEAMTALIDQLLMLARADAQGLTLKKERVALKAAIEAVPDGDPRVAVSGEGIAEADQASVVRIAANLIGNAKRHTAPDGEIIVTASENKQWARLEVRDNGDGIPAADLPQITERFYRADSARSRASGGTGLGLAITKSLTEAMGGRLEIESEAGKGTVVRVFLPKWPGTDGSS
jgi:signal transduction histidine kinase